MNGATSNPMPIPGDADEDDQRHVWVRSCCIPIPRSSDAAKPPAPIVASQRIGKCLVFRHHWAHCQEAPDCLRREGGLAERIASGKPVKGDASSRCLTTCS